MKRRLFQWFTGILLIACVWTAYANVVSDDTDVRAKARATVNAAAGCGDDCKIENLRGERGMLSEEINYDLVKYGHFVVTCRRAYVSVGDYTCVVTEGKVSSRSSSSASASGSSSATPPPSQK